MRHEGIDAKGRLADSYSRYSWWIVLQLCLAGEAVTLEMTKGDERPMAFAAQDSLQPHIRRFSIEERRTAWLGHHTYNGAA